MRRGADRRRPGGAPRARVPRLARLRHSLLVRVLAGAVLVAVCSITATAWLAVRGVSGEIRNAEGRSLAADTRIHGELVGFAATHTTWQGVGARVSGLAEETGRRVALTTQDGTVIADSQSGEALPATAASVVDPLAVDVTLGGAGEEQGDRIDPRVIGPYALDEEERADLERGAVDGASCLRSVFGLEAEAGEGASGRPTVLVDGEPLVADTHGEMWFECGLDASLGPVASEETALEDLSGRIDGCLRGTEYASAGYALDPMWAMAGNVPVPGPLPYGAPVGADPGGDTGGGEATRWPRGETGRDTGAPVPDPVPPTADTGAGAGEGAGAGALPEEQAAASEVAECIDFGRREQLSTSVAPAAVLYTGEPGADGGVAGPMLSRDGLLRISGVVLLILVLTVAVSVVLSLRMVRPLHALTGAVQRMRDGEEGVAVRVRDSGEIGRLAAAFNEMSEHLQRAEEQRKALISDVSHELRTPLSNIRGWLEAGQDGIAEMDEERLSVLVEEAVLLQRIIDDLRDLSLADAGRLRLAVEPVDVGALARRCSAGHAARAGAAGVELAVDAAKGAVVLGDPARLQQAVGNLLENALRHTPPSGRVGIRVLRAGGTVPGDVLIEVADTGHGIPEEDLPHLFTRFWRAEKSRSRQAGGSGLGLAIVDGITRLHGGRASVRSTVGEGSVFTLRFPAHTLDLDTGVNA
ncbi:sensor histidine kinase [Nocardiopsis suaedae]|uniref:histidine kinase n=1 Tax=Nocardiopsis suaedae TaxID=3018444 RepID=A0ABT4TF96_9ACTN|nr:HAMP domain-containing sensor histidine kinase [Nocardiopsis suaedae]MDA2803368.1 HAMP domain-containing sensor histidine kinase [Nocardiopsis suaedae]